MSQVRRVLGLLCQLAFPLALALALASAATGESAEPADAGESPAQVDASGEGAAAAEGGAEGELAEAEAEEPEEPPVPALVRAAAGFVAVLETLSEEHDDLEAKMKIADESDKLVLDRQLIDIKLEYLELMGRLVANLLAQEKEGLDASELRALLENELVALTPILVRHVEISEQVTADLRRIRDEAEIAGVLAIEQELEREVGWLDRLYRSYVENIQHRQSLGLDTEKPLEGLSLRLSERTRLQGARLQLVLEQQAGLAKRKRDSPDDPELELEQAALVARRAMLTESVARLAKQMDSLGLDATKQQQLIITSTGEVTSDIFKPEVALGLVQGWFDGVRRWVRESGPGVLFDILVFIFIVAVARLLSMLSRRLLRRALSTSRMQSSQLLQRMIVAGVSNSIFLLGILIALSQLGLQLGPLLAGLGIAGFIVGFALQDSLANFAAGMMILGYRPFDMGDVIDAAGVRGTVSYMSLVNTTILTFDNRTLIIPNNKIWGDVITNLTNQDKRRVDLTVRIGYEQDLDRVQRVLLDVLGQDERILEDPPAAVKLHEFGEFAMVLIVRPWALTDDYWNVYWDVTGAIKRRLDAEGIPIAVPQTEVRMLAASDKGDASRPGPSPIG